MPFNSVAEMVEAQTGHALPKESKEISAKISWMEATSKLRWFETVHALMNFGSLIHNMPAIFKGMQRLKGETDEQWMQRIGHVGSVFGTGKNQTAVPNAGKILYGAFKDRSEEHTSELQSLMRISYAVFCLKKKQTTKKRKKEHTRYRSN